ncbi:MAG: hypothetical protein Q7S48_02550 [bacterium]|nr:hypothetical protein [bacterium]
MQNNRSLWKLGTQCALAAFITVGLYAVLYNLELLPGYVAIFAAGVPALVVALIGVGLGRKEESLPFLATATGAAAISTLLSFGHTISLLFWWQEPGQAGIMFLCFLGLTVVAVLCIVALDDIHQSVPNNWASTLILGLSATAVAFGLCTDVMGGGEEYNSLCWGTPDEFGECAHPLMGYLYGSEFLVAIAVFAYFSPVPDLEKFRAKQEKALKKKKADLQKTLLCTREEIAHLRETLPHAQE